MGGGELVEAGLLPGILGLEFRLTHTTQHRAVPCRCNLDCFNKLGNYQLESEMKFCGYMFVLGGPYVFARYKQY